MTFLPQEIHLVCAAFATKPTAHRVHAPAPAAVATVAFAHGRHGTPPAPKLPGLHSSAHSPTSVVYVPVDRPAGQAMQELAPPPLMCLPAGHAWQRGWSSPSALYLPGAQCAHSGLPSLRAA